MYSGFMSPDGTHETEQLRTNNPISRIPRESRHLVERLDLAYRGSGRMLPKKIATPHCLSPSRQSSSLSGWLCMSDSVAKRLLGYRLIWD